MTSNRYSMGWIIVIVGIALLLGKLGFFSFLGRLFWPIFVLAPGLLLHYLFFRRVLPSGVLIPAGILTTYSLLFFFCNLFGWAAMSYMWPVFILGPAIGLYECYIFDRDQPRGVLIASLILGATAFICWSMMLLFTIGVYVIALILIAVGLYMIFVRTSRS